MSGNKWFAVDVFADETATDAVESAFAMFDCLGTETYRPLAAANEPVRVSAYFDGAPPSDEEVSRRLNETLGLHGFSSAMVNGIQYRSLADADWLAEWKKHWQPVEVGPFIIAPPWAEVAETDKQVIRIEPQMAFGTGTHETTQLCLKAIGEHYAPSMSLLDVGTGTGILAIAAAKIATENTEKKIGVVSSAARILACDTDPDSIAIARKNAILNGVADYIDFFQGSIDPNPPPFDIVVANLTLDVIIPILPLLLATAQKSLILSGILIEQENDVRRALADLDVIDVTVDRSGEWVSLRVLLSGVSLAAGP
jgi:ribosomal protein L11 methyltransferase